MGDVEVVLLILLEDGAGFGGMGAGTTRPDFLGEVPWVLGRSWFTTWSFGSSFRGKVGLRVGLALSYPFEEVPEGDEVVLPGTLEEGPVGERGIPLLDPLGEVLEGFELEGEEPSLPLFEESLEAIGLEVVSERNKC